MNLKNETQYQNRFIQAGKTNKLRFIEKLKYFKNTSNIAKFNEALMESFEFLYSNISSEDSCGCNKVSYHISYLSVVVFFLLIISYYYSR